MNLVCGPQYPRRNRICRPGIQTGALTDEEVAKLGIGTKTVELRYKVGDVVAIVGGPLEGFEGTVETIDMENNKVRVIVSMFGRNTPVELALEQASPRE
jgi:transcriptional antiterminator NusG